MSEPATPPVNPNFKAHYQTHLDEGTVVLTIPPSLSGESVADFEYWIGGITQQLHRRAAQKATDSQKGETDE